MASIGFLALALSCLASIMLQFRGNPADLGFLTADRSLAAELFAWVFFVIALLFVLRSAAARDSSRLVRVGVSVCVLGALLECTSVGFSVHAVSYVIPPASLYKAEFSLAALGWCALAVGVFIIQRNWADRRPARGIAGMAAWSEQHPWQRALLVVTIALMCSALGATLGFGNYVAWPHSRTQAVLLSSYAPQVLTWVSVALAGFIVVNAARRGRLARRLAIPASFAAAGGVVLTVSTMSLLAAVELLYRYLKFAWIAPLIQTEAVAACVGMLVFAGACIAAAAGRQELPPRGRAIPSAPPYWPQVGTATS
jgi:hypothetical protein